MTAPSGRAAELRAEARAWRMVAEHVDANGLAGGLCVAAASCMVAPRLSGRGATDGWYHRWHRMFRRARDHVYVSPDRRGAYAYPPGQELGARVLAALWLALECEDEARKVGT